MRSEILSAIIKSVSMLISGNMIDTFFNTPFLFAFFHQKGTATFDGQQGVDRTVKQVIFPIYSSQSQVLGPAQFLISVRYSVTFCT